MFYGSLGDDHPRQKIRAYYSRRWFVVEFQMVPVPTVHSGWLLPGLFGAILPAWLLDLFFCQGARSS